MFLFFIGIDISKEWFDVVLRSKAYPNTIYHQKFSNDTSGFSAFKSWLSSHGLTRLEEVFVCLEHTGVYAVPICQFLNETSMTYTLIPGVIVSQAGIQRGKNDKADAHKLSLFAMRNHEDLSIHTLSSEAVRLLKTLLGLRKRLMKAKHILLVSYKEIKGFETQQVSEPIVTSSQKVIKDIELQLKQTEKEIDQVLKANEELKRNYDLLLSVPGIGRQSALHMIVFTKNFVSFICPKKFAAFSGIAPFQSSSGSSIRSRTKVSPKANKKMKSLLTSAVNSSLVHCQEYKQYFDKQIERGKNEFSVKNVIRNKIVSRAFAVIKRGTPYLDLHRALG